MIMEKSDLKGCMTRGRGGGVRHKGRKEVLEARKGSVRKAG